MYNITFTHAAQVDAAKYPGGLTALETCVRKEVDELLDDGLDCVIDLILHTVMNDSGPEFICFPDEAGDLVVDACEREDMGELDRGPMAGKRVMMPKGFT